MNYPDCFLAWNDIKHSINNIYVFYDSQFENKQSSQPVSSSRFKSSLLSGLLSAFKRSRRSDSLNGLHYYFTRAIPLKIDAGSGFENFDILAW